MTSYKAKFLFILLIGTILFEFPLFNIILVKKELTPLIIVDELIETPLTFKLAYYLVLLLITLTTFYLYSKKLYSKASFFLFLEVLFWLFKLIFIRNQYYLSSELGIIETPNILIVTYDFFALLIRVLLIYYITVKNRLSIKLVAFIGLAILVIILKIRFFPFPIFYFDWQ